MKRAAEVKPSVRCSEEPGAGDGSMCAVSITKRAKIEEPEAADGITRRSPKPLAADGAGIAKKRARKAEKPSKKEKGADEKSKRSKKNRAEEMNQQPNKVEVVVEEIMAKLSEFDKKRAKEKSKISNQEKRIEKMLIRLEKIASIVEEQLAGDGMKKEKRTKKPEGNEAMGEVAGSEVIIEEQVAGDGMRKEKRTKKPEGNEAMGKVEGNEVTREMMADNEAGGVKKKKKIVTWKLSQELLDYLLTKEVMGLLATEAPLELRITKIIGSLFDQTLKEEIAAEFQENREFDAHVLYQYRTNGYAEIEEEVSDEEDDVEADKEEP